MNFIGKIPPSKSLLARYLITKSYFPELEGILEAQCEDVKVLKKSLKNFNKRQAMDVKLSGTGLRFLALRVLREKGDFEIKGHPRLFSRPQKELLQLIAQLGAKAEITDNKLLISSKGFHPLGDNVYIDASKTSQLASSMILNSWNLKRPLSFSIKNLSASSSYFEMTLNSLKDLGMKWMRDANSFYIPPHQKIRKKKITLEPDMSSAFSVAAISAIKGSSCFLDFPQKSLQPDFKFISILKQMNVPIYYMNQNTLKINESPYLKGIHWNHENNLDLFPVLSALCVFAKTESLLSGLSNLKYKESKRLDKILELLDLIKKEHKLKKDQLWISEKKVELSKNVFFDTDLDHRLAFACSLLRKKGLPIEFSQPSVINKSFPEFYSYIGLNP